MEKPNLADGLIHWLKSLCAWHRALHQPHVRSILSSQNLTITGIKPHSPEEPGRRGEIGKVMAMVMLADPSKAATTVLQEWAKSLKEEHMKAGKLHDRELWDALATLDEGKWSSAPTSKAKVHCESQLAWRIDPRSQDPAQVSSSQSLAQSPKQRLTMISGVQAGDRRVCSVLLHLRLIHLQAQSEPDYNRYTWEDLSLDSTSRCSRGTEAGCPA